MMDLRNLNSRLLLPPTIMDDQETIIFSKLADKVFSYLANMIVYVQSCNDTKLLPEVILDNLSWELNVDFYELDLPIEKKQGLIDNAILNQILKGTPIAVENLLKVVFDKSEVEEWFEYGGSSSMFKIKTTDQLDEGKYQSIRDVIGLVKNTRSRLESFVLLREKESNLTIGTYIHSAKKVVIDTA